MRERTLVIRMRKIKTTFLVALSLSALATLVSAHAMFAECGERGANVSLELGAPLPRGMGRGLIDSSTRTLTVTNAATREPLASGATVAAGSVVSVELPSLPGEQVLCEATDGATFPGGCHRQSNEMAYALRAPASGSFSVWCVHSSGPGRGMFATERVTFKVGSVASSVTLALSGIPEHTAEPVDATASAMETDTDTETWTATDESVTSTTNLPLATHTAVLPTPVTELSSGSTPATNPVRVVSVGASNAATGDDRTRTAAAALALVSVAAAVLSSAL